MGDYVYIINETKKFDVNYQGPYLVLETPSEAFIVVDRKGKPYKIHKNRTKKSYATGNNFTQPDAALMGAYLQVCDKIDAASV